MAKLGDGLEGRLALAAAAGQMFCPDAWPFSAMREVWSQRAAGDALWLLPSEEEAPCSSSLGAWFGRSWIFTVLYPPMCQLGHVPTILLSSLVAWAGPREVSPSPEEVLRTPEVLGTFWAQLICQEPVCTLLSAMGVCCTLDLYLFPCWFWVEEQCAPHQYLWHVLLRAGCS